VDSEKAEECLLISEARDVVAGSRSLLWSAFGHMYNEILEFFLRNSCFTYQKYFNIRKLSTLKAIDL